MPVGSGFCDSIETLVASSISKIENVCRRFISIGSSLSLAAWLTRGERVSYGVGVDDIALAHEIKFWSGEFRRKPAYFDRSITFFVSLTLEADSRERSTAPEAQHSRHGSNRSQSWVAGISLATHSNFS